MTVFAISDCLGKTFADSESGEIKAFASLTGHCLNVAKTFRRLVDIPVISERLTTLAGREITGTEKDRLSVFAGLHDIGKSNIGFQDKLIGKSSGRGIGHVQEVSPLLLESALNEKLETALDMSCLDSWCGGREAAYALLMASLAHHGRPVPELLKKGIARNYDRAKHVFWNTSGNVDPFAHIHAVTNSLRDAFAGAFNEERKPLPSHPRFQHYYAGLVTLADWIGSHEYFFPLTVSGHAEQHVSDDEIVAALSRIGLDSTASFEECAARNPGFVDIFGFAPRMFQERAEDLIVQDPGDRLMIIEAETGSGKTEAALAAFYRVIKEGKAGGLYFALPTRVAARELYKRTLDSLEKVFPDGNARPMALLAAPGYVKVDGVDPKTILPTGSLRYQDDGKDERGWAAERPKRFLAATIAVGTIDQALLSAVQASHAHMRSVCLSRHVLIIDEVHSSDEYMRQLTKDLVNIHVGMGGYAILLSATLGATAKNEFIEAVGGKRLSDDFQSAVDAAYPVITMGSGKTEPATGAGNTREKRVEATAIPHYMTPAKSIPLVARATAAGCKTLVIMNTVARANKFLRAMEQDPSIPSGVLFRVENVTCPHHGRFARPDREIMDVRVSSMFGKGSADGPAILVGTQTLEQSLDLDADFMITDLCPMDVLLQRIGRLHRRDKPRRPLGYGSGRVAVLVPEDMTMESFLNDRGEAIKREGIGSVYENVGILRLTLDCLHARPVLNIPADNRFLVESATHPEKLNGLTGGKWKRHLNARHGSDLAEKVSARDVSILPILDKPFYDPESPDDSAKFGDFGNKLTRLGAEDRVVEFSAPFLSPFGVEIKEMIVPHHMAPGGEVGNKAEIISGPDEPVRFTFGNKTYTYSRFGLEEEK